MIVEYLIYLFIATALVNVIYWFLLCIKLLSHRSTQNNNPKTSLSIVVCVKNGEKHVNNIQYLKNQKLLSNELIIVDDFSSDNTLALLEKFRSADTQIVTPDEDLKGKKSALKKGILSATKDIVLLTDIDCTPASDQWASKILQSYKEDQDIILGYGPYLKFPGLLNKLLRYETVLTAIQYLSYALYHIPYMGVGRNLSYKKSVFLNSDQFSSHMHIPSGDDDLFIASVGKQHKVGVCLDPDSFTYSEPEKTWRSFYKQKSRHISTSSAYSLLHKLLLSVGSSSHILIFVLLLILVTLGSVQLAFYIFFFRLFLLTFILAPAISKLKEKDLIYYLPLLDVILFLYYVILIPALIFKRKEW